MKPRIALYLPSLRGGGAERVMVTLARGFAEREVHVDLVLARAEGPYLSHIPENVRLLDLGASRVAASLPALVRYLRRERPQAMLSALNHANVLAVAARWLARVPTRLILSEHSSVDLSITYAKSLRERWMPSLMRRTYPRADAIVAVSAGVRAELIERIALPRARISVIHNPIVSRQILAQAGEPPGHPWLNSGAPLTLLAAGRLSREKDFPTLIRAFAQVRAGRPVRLIILGEGEERMALQAQVRSLGLEEEVALPGFVENPFAFMRQAAVFVLSSSGEGFGNVLVEAMACGRPVVSTDCPGGPSEILENGRWGRLVPVGDVTALAEAIAATLDDPNPPNVARRAQDFVVDQAVEAYLDLLLGTRRKGRQPSTRETR